MGGRGGTKDVLLALIKNTPLWHDVAPKVDKASSPMGEERDTPLPYSDFTNALALVREHGQDLRILDEASMVDKAMLAMACDVFDQVLLVGDPGQLPPVDGEPALDEIEHFLLTEIHRQAQASKIVQLAYAVRDGLQYWRRPLAAYAPDVHVCEHYPAREAARGPVIVARNDTRIACTLAIRQALGYPADRPVVGEPLVCRARSGGRASRAYTTTAPSRCAPWKTHAISW